jgi:hypothetical protein
MDLKTDADRIRARIQYKEDEIKEFKRIFKQSERLTKYIREHKLIIRGLEEALMYLEEE